jgi:photosynthetic reaction center H subunit
MAKKTLETEDGVRIRPLSSLSDFQVAEGHRDVRGWRVLAVDESEVGRVHELLVDMDSMRTRYLDIRLHSSLAAADADRDVLVPIGAARIDDAADVVVVPLTVERISLLPAYDHRHLLASHEAEIRRHFALGEAAVGPTVRRIPVNDGDSVSIKRGDDGRDEIIVRAPRQP